MVGSGYKLICGPGCRMQQNNISPLNPWRQVTFKTLRFLDCILQFMCPLSPTIISHFSYCGYYTCSIYFSFSHFFTLYLFKIFSLPNLTPSFFCHFFQIINERIYFAVFSFLGCYIPSSKWKTLLFSCEGNLY